MNRTALVALVIVGLVGGTALVLSLGGSDAGASADATGDISIGEGPRAPSDPSLADIESAEVRRLDGGEIAFEVTMTSSIPAGETSDALSFRWDIIENGEETWYVSANFLSGPTASVSSLTSDFGASTIDHTLDGTIALSGPTLVVTLTPSGIEDFPTTFAWGLTSSLDGDPADPASATATDTAPDSGRGTLE